MSQSKKALDVLFCTGCLQVSAAAPEVDLDLYTTEELMDIYQDTGVTVDALQAFRSRVATRLKTLLPETPKIEEAA